MNKSKILNLLTNLKEYDELYFPKDIVIENSISILIKDLENKLSEMNSTSKKKSNIMDIIYLIEENAIDEINSNYPKIKYNNILTAINFESKQKFEEIEKYTIIQLKVFYFLLTKNKINNAIKTSKKDIVFNAVVEVIRDINRNNDLKNL